MSCDAEPKKTLAVVTGTRAEYGLLRPVLKKLYARDELTVKLLVTGAHLSPAFGETVKEIEADGFSIAVRVDILKFGTADTLATARTVSYAIGAFADLFSTLRPDGCLVLGDRYEIFAAAAAAALLRVPVLHISGGDVTKGAADDWLRHSITKMASLHFPSCEAYADRIIRMGEEPRRVYNVGGLGDENIRTMRLLSKQQLADSIGVDLTNPYLLLTYHPETLAKETPPQQFKALLKALDGLPGYTLLFTKANADAGGGQINALIDAYVEKRGHAAAFESLGVLRYLSAMKYAAAVVGNSSSGMVETPSFGTPCVNIGSRQEGRILCGNVISCGAKEAEIAAALQKALGPDFQEEAKNAVSPYRGEDPSGDIARLSAEFLYGPLSHEIKSFYDGPKGAQ